MPDDTIPGPSTDELGPLLARRGLMLGAGAAALVAGSLAGARPGHAEPLPPKHSAEQQELSPVTSTIGSPAVSGYTYRNASWLDFHVEGGAATRVYGGLGAYSSGSSPYLWATVDVPSGAIVRDIEWYVYNNSGSTIAGLGRLWAAGTGTLFNTLADTPIPSSSDIVARRTVVPSSTNGPHPIGTKIALGINTAGGGTIQINGVRVGFSQGAGAVGLLPAPVRAYDSRVTGGKLSAGSTRTITLPSSLVGRGVSGVIANITAASPEGGGYLRVYPANAAPPPSSTVSYQADRTVANMIFVGVSSSRQIKVYASTAVHVIVDVTGTIG